MQSHVVEDHATVLEVLDIDRVFVQTVVFLDALGFDAVQAGVFFEVAE